MAWLCCLLIALVLGLAPWPPQALAAEQPLQLDHYRCDDQPLQAAVFPGAVDAVGIPNTSAGTLPGAYVVLQWRGLSLQLPRTNNAGAPSYTDGRWWWSPLDPDQPQFRERRASVHTYSCVRDNNPEAAGRS
jgi:hypothetical protein